MPSAALPTRLVERTLERLGFTAPPSPDHPGLRAVYAAWCAHVPFDNLRKMIALRTPQTAALPGGHATDFLGTWLDHGAGGTCWPSSNALCEFLLWLGFAARRIAASMRDSGILNHGSIKVRLEGTDWLVDSSILSNLPLPLRPEVFIAPDPVFAVEIEPDAGSHLLWIDFPPNADYLPCRLHTDPVDHDFYLASYEAARQRSPFNERLYARRNHPGEMRLLVGNTLHRKTAHGLTSRALSRPEIETLLREDFGYSEALVASWVRAGCLDASFAPPTGPAPPPVTGKPPSKR